MLHNLLAQDDQFTFPNLYEVFFPHTFLCTEDVRANQVTPLIPFTTRVMDNVAQGLGMPNEDEFATCATSLLSPYMLWAFPRNQERYERYLTFLRRSQQGGRAGWKAEFLRFARKLTLRRNRPLLLKSPPHTCRIKLLLELFSSSAPVSCTSIATPYTDLPIPTKHSQRGRLTRCLLQFQHARPRELDDAILAAILLDASIRSFFEERPLIPEGHFHELAFEDLEADPIGQVRLALRSCLGLSGFDGVLPHLDDYVHDLSGYRKNTYPPSHGRTASATGFARLGGETSRSGTTRSERIFPGMGRHDNELASLPPGDHRTAAGYTQSARVDVIPIGAAA